MEILAQYGIKIPNAVLVKYSVNPDTDKEVIDFLTQYGAMSKFEVIDDSDSVFHDCIIVEFESGNAVAGLRKILPYVYICQTEKVTYEIKELSTACSHLETEAKTQTYLGDLKNLAKLTGQNYTDVLKNVMSLLGQSFSQLESGPQVKTPPEEDEGTTVTPLSLLPSAVASRSEHGVGTAAQDPEEELPQIRPDPAARYTPRPSLPAMSLPDINPPQVRYVVEHIMKNDDAAMHTSQRLRTFSGRTPRPQHETDYETWCSGVSLLLKDPAVSDLQRSRKIFDSLLPPAADMVKHLRPDTPPLTYLQILDSAYGTVQDGDELYAKFVEMFQDAGERPSAYLQRLQVALHLAVKRGGVLSTNIDKHLLNQFCRGCWDNALISDLQLKQRKSEPPSFAELLLLLRTEEDREAAKAQRMKQHLGSSKPRASTHAQYVYAAAEEKSACDNLTIITQQLAKQLADIQTQLNALTAAQSASAKSNPGSKFSQPSHTSRAAPRPSHRSSSSGPKPGYCYNCGEDGHIKPHCDNDPNPSLVAAKKRQFSEKQKKWQRTNPHGAPSLN